jgi:hypothetical protein
VCQILIKIPAEPLFISFQPPIAEMFSIGKYFPLQVKNGMLILTPLRFSQDMELIDMDLPTMMVNYTGSE